MLPFTKKEVKTAPINEKVHDVPKVGDDIFHYALGHGIINRFLLDGSVVCDFADSEVVLNLEDFVLKKDKDKEW